jgi:peptidoglycan hydrolase CwlO-like protein
MTELEKMKQQLSHIQTQINNLNFKSGSWLKRLKDLQAEMEECIKMITNWVG